MDRTYVQSRDLLSVGYENGVLEVEFHSGGIYRYSGVPQGIYENLMSAASKGGYHAAHIKGRYGFRKI